jgi:hypothetical protein
MHMYPDDAPGLVGLSVGLCLVVPRVYWVREASGDVVDEGGDVAADWARALDGLRHAGWAGR